MSQMLQTPLLMGNSQEKCYSRHQLTRRAATCISMPNQLMPVINDCLEPLQITSCLLLIFTWHAVNINNGPLSWGKAGKREKGREEDSGCT